MMCDSHASMLSVGTLNVLSPRAMQALALLWPPWLEASSSALLWTWTYLAETSCVEPDLTTADHTTQH